MEIKDSGDRRVFYDQDGHEGAVRDMAEGKGRFDLTALQEVADIVLDVAPQHFGNDLKGYVLRYLADFYDSHDMQDIRFAIIRLGIEAEKDVFSMMIEYSIHCENGAKKYGENNIRKGVKTSSLLDSAVRHYVKWLRGDDDEDHWVASLWNMMWLMWTIRNKPEFDDLKGE